MEPQPDPSHPPLSERASFWLALAIAALALGWQLGVRGLNEPDEGRYASVAYEMLRSGDWLAPSFQGHLHVSKPPLTYWLTAASFALFGVNEWAARLVPALAALFTVLLTWSLACRWWGPRTALHAALILLSAPLFFIVAHLADPNMLLTFWVALGIRSWIAWQEEGRARDRWFFYLAHAGAFLTKGPVGCVLILLAAVSFRLFAGERLPRRRTWSWPGFLLAAGLGLSWYLVMIARQPELFDYFWKRELVERVASNVHKRDEPFWFFWWVTPLGFLPWLCLFAPGARREGAASGEAWPGRPLLAYALLAILLFSLSASKLATYVTPLFPALALLAAGRTRDGNGGPGPRDPRRFFVAALAFALPPLLLAVGRVKFHWAHLLHFANALALGVALAFGWLALRPRSRGWIPPAALLVLTAYAATLDIARRHQDDLGSASSARRQVRALARAAAARPGPVYFAHAPASLEFYLQSAEPLHPLRLAPTGTVMQAAEYARQLAACIDETRTTNAYVIASTHFLRKAMAAGELPPRFHVLDPGWKYTILRVD